MKTKIEKEVYGYRESLKWEENYCMSLDLRKNYLGIEDQRVRKIMLIISKLHWSDLEREK
jgi:hypothetical protein